MNFGWRLADQDAPAGVMLVKARRRQEGDWRPASKDQGCSRESGGCMQIKRAWGAQIKRALKQGGAGRSLFGKQWRDTQPFSPPSPPLIPPGGWVPGLATAVLSPSQRGIISAALPSSSVSVPFFSCHALFTSRLSLSGHLPLPLPPALSSYALSFSSFLFFDIAVIVPGTHIRESVCLMLSTRKQFTEWLFDYDETSCLCQIYFSGLLYVAVNIEYFSWFIASRQTLSIINDAHYMRSVRGF